MDSHRQASFLPLNANGNFDPDIFWPPQENPPPYYFLPRSPATDTATSATPPAPQPGITAISQPQVQPPPRSNKK
jgi:hypothetical protein